MRIKAAIQGSLKEIMAQELSDATAGVQAGVREAGELLQSGWRQQVGQAGLGEGLQKSVRLKFYANEGLDAASWVYAKSQKIFTAFERGAVVRSRHGRFLAIPTPEALALARRRAGRFGTVSPANWPKGLPPLRFVPRTVGPSLLVIDEMRRTTAGRLTVAKRTKRGAFGRGASTVVMFILLRQVTMRKTLDLQSVTDRVERMLPDLILRYYRETPQAAGRVAR